MTIKITNVFTTSLRPLLDRMRPRPVYNAPRDPQVVKADKTSKIIASPELPVAGYRQGREEGTPRVVAKGGHLRTRSTKGRR